MYHPSVTDLSTSIIVHHTDDDTDHDLNDDISLLTSAINTSSDVTVTSSTNNTATEDITSTSIESIEEH